MTIAAPPLFHGSPPPGRRFWLDSSDGVPAGYALYRRHYSAKNNPNPKQRQFVGPGEKLVLITPDGDALWAWRKFINDGGQVGVNCAVFRNESSHRSSDMILEAMDIGWAKWPGERFYTYVDAAEISSPNPGYCFKIAGWRFCGRSDSGKEILEVFPAEGWAIK